MNFYYYSYIFIRVISCDLPPSPDTTIILSYAIRIFPIPLILLFIIYYTIL